MRNKYVYPCLAPVNKDYSFFRISGPGLANCMIIAAKAYCVAKESGARFIEPTWFKLSIGPYIRGEKDKRHYFKIFNTIGVSGLSKLMVLLRKSDYDDDNLLAFINASSGVCRIRKMRKLFQDMDPTVSIEYFDSLVTHKTKEALRGVCFEKTVAIHVRLGDYHLTDFILDIRWYKNIINNLNNTFNNLNFLLFSDGNDNELKDLISIPNVKRVFFGNAIADIIAISRCSLLIGSNSTFSGMGCFISQIPAIYSQCHFQKVLCNDDDFLKLGNSTDIPEKFIYQLKNKGF